ncbi:LacI family DNA-binding transcriptional regulator [Nesterenkonia xinjiangensis]|uniref:DNA-binding LacI/PurR family transcriptional regulator n=1 Tax=Nesterenkonia xinjiangensis TaxID=225327 RepID=A0A7Z0GL93_9MICC|nr:DNA-binding LacI/PurR family transcriptional regulator [Nesterenkonia xinjiangensis]
MSRETGGRRAPTLEDVAARAGVSRATASRVVNEDLRVRPAAREAVLDAVAELGYRPNRAARSLVTREAGSIAVVVPEAEDRVFRDPFFASLLVSITQALADSTVQVLLAMGRPGDGCRKIEKYLRGGGTDGAIVVSHHQDEEIWRALRETRLPAVHVGRPQAGGAGLPYVDMDNEAGGALAAEHLISRGRRRIGTIAGPQDMAPGADRLSGWRRAMRAAGLADDLVEIADFSAESGGERMRRLLRREKGLDAVFVASDLMAVAAIHEIQAAGLQVPEQIAVVGFDDSQAASLSRPSLTTVRNPVDSLATTAVDMLLRLMQGEEAKSVVLDTQLVRRASTDFSVLK